MGQGFQRALGISHGVGNGTPVFYAKHLLNRKVRLTAIDTGGVYDIEGSNDPAGTQDGVTLVQTWTKIKTGLSAAGDTDVPDNYHHYRIATTAYTSGTGAAAFLVGMDLDDA